MARSTDFAWFFSLSSSIYLGSCFGSLLCSMKYWCSNALIAVSSSVLRASILYAYLGCQHVVTDYLVLEIVWLTFFISLPPLVWTGGHQTLLECCHIQ